MKPAIEIDSMSKFLTLEQAAERLGVEYKTIYRLVRQGLLPAGCTASATTSVHGPPAPASRS